MNRFFCNVVTFLVLLLSMSWSMMAQGTSRPKGSTSERPADVPSIMDEYDDETDGRDESVRSDSYRGRSRWSPDQFSRYADSVGMESRSGQSAAIAHIIASMRQGDMTAARKRLRTLFATPGYMLDPDLAQVLHALDILLQNNKPTQKQQAMAARIDTVFRTDTVVREIVRVDTVFAPSSERQPDTNAYADGDDPTDTVYVEVVKYDTIYVNPEEGEEDPMRNLAGDGVLDKSEESDKANSKGAESAAASPGTPPSADAELGQKVDRLADEVIRLQSALRDRPATFPDAAVTRRCFTIHIASFTNRAEAERTVNRIRKRYKRTRLAIANGTPAPYSVIVGYYQTASSAKKDAEMVSKATGQRCSPVETTIAERL